VTSKKGERLTEFWQAGIFGHFWTFGADSFETISEDIATRSSLDDKLVALTLAFAIYRRMAAPPRGACGLSAWQGRA